MQVWMIEIRGDDGEWRIFTNAGMRHSYPDIHVELAYWEGRFRATESECVLRARKYTVTPAE